MGKRKPIPKSARFEVFKRDAFKCQYCGRSAPDVILEVDHIVPVSAGGTNELLNLITSCRDCNRGKRDRLLSDTTVIDRQKRQLEEMNEIREQTEMLVQWKQELLTLSEGQVDAIESLAESLTGFGFSDVGRKNMRNYIRRFGFSEVYDAAEIAFCKYGDFEDAFRKIGGICFNRAKQKAGAENSEPNDQR